MPTRKASIPDDDLDDDGSPEELEDLEDSDDLEDLDDTGDLDEDDDGNFTDQEENADGDGDNLLPDATGVLVVERPAEETEDEDDEEQDDEDVEASLDVILKERLVVEDEPDDEEPADVEDRSEMSERVRPKQPDEFVCRSCFLVKHPSQLADKKKMLCRDCV